MSYDILPEIVPMNGTFELSLLPPIYIKAWSLNTFMEASENAFDTSS